MSYFDNNYPQEPIGGGNPYFRCVSCKLSAPQINGRLENHESWCSYRESRAAPAEPAEAPAVVSAMVDARLDPCPFCGAGQTQIRPNGRVWMGMKFSEPASVSVLHHCEAVPGQPSRAIERVGRDEASAIAAWNQRAPITSESGNLRPSEGPGITSGTGCGSVAPMSDEDVKALIRQRFLTGEQMKRDHDWLFRSGGTPSNVWGMDLVWLVRETERLVHASIRSARPAVDPQLQTSEERRATGQRIEALLLGPLEQAQLDKAREIVVGHQRGSISLVQRHLKVGYNMAARLLEELEKEGTVSPMRPNGGREVLVLPNTDSLR